MTEHPPAIRPIQRSYLHDDVARAIRSLIQSGELKPGERIHEGALADRFGISRTPLREAIKILATEGLLELLPNRGARVVVIAEAEIEEMLEVIAGLEATAGELACQRIAPEALGTIRALHEAMVCAHEAGDVAGYLDRNRAIHEGIVAAAGNATLAAVYNSLSGRVQRARYVARRNEAERVLSIADHERMVAFLQARDGPGLGALLRAHVLARKAVIVATFAVSWPPPPAPPPAAAARTRDGRARSAPRRRG